MGVHSIKNELRRAVFLDRDGVINRAIVRNGKPYPPATLDELEILTGVPEALHALKAAGFLLIGVTNQPDVVRGTQRREVVEAINAALISALPLDEILVCYHDDQDGCECRKPLPGLLIQAAFKYAVHLPSSFMVGDRWKDIEAGRRAGCTTVLIDCDYAEQISSPPDHRVHSLLEATAWIISRSKSVGEIL
jgi:D-glycero-D-manno-heptose 1,7-bisphosphate phosphatase